MTQVAAVATIPAPPALDALLDRWPVICHVEGERASADLPALAAFPALTLVTAGALDVQLSGTALTQLVAGDLVIAHDPTEVTFSEAALEQLDPRTNWRIDQAHGASSVVVVRLECVGTHFHPGLMPKPYVVRGGRPIDQSLRTALIEAARANAPQAVANAAAVALYLQCIHDHLASRTQEIQMLGGLFDPEVGTVVAAMMEAPARDWTVESLANVGGMSRSAFARKFRDLMGAAPIDFLVEVRMWQAARSLKQQSRDMRSIALEAGYQSPAAFSVAFKRWSGETPSDYRRGT
jgi:AraC-like DNA-binding protein